MAITPVTVAVKEGYATAVAAFVHASIPHILWANEAGGTLRIFGWRRHDAADTTEVRGGASVRATGQIAGTSLGDGNLLVVYDDGQSIYDVVFDLTTGVTVRAPRLITRGATKPALSRLDRAPIGRITLTCMDEKRTAVYVQESYDNGVTWGDLRAVLNARVRETKEVQSAVFGEKHLSIIQTGTDGKALCETGSYDRTRPLSAVLLHPLRVNSVIAVESTTRSASASDNLRGNLAVIENTLFATTRQRLGTDDGVGDVMVVDATVKTSPTLVASVAPTAGAAPGAEIVRIDLDTLTVRDVTPLGVGGIAAQIAAADTHVFAACYREDVIDGGLAVMRYSDRATSVMSPGVHFHGVAVSRAYRDTVENTVIATCRMIGAANYLAIGRLGPDPLSPQWNLATHALPARADALTLSMLSESQGYVYAALADRLCVYKIDGLDKPIRLLNTNMLLTVGRVMQMIVAPNGNLVCALGEGGVAVFAPDGAVLSHLQPSALYVAPWMPKTAYALNALVTPPTSSTYFGQRRYFRCSTPGTTGTVSPAWKPSGTVTGDGTAAWTEAGSTDAVVNSIALDYTNRRIFAAGVLGGATGTRGRVYCIDARGLV